MTSEVKKINKKKDAKYALLEKMFEHERERANKWKEAAERISLTNNELQEKLMDCIKKRNDLKKKYSDTVNNRTMYKWFLEYLEDGNGKETTYFRIYIEAEKAGFLKKVVHKDHENADAVSWKKSIEDKIRRRLQTHCKLNNLKFP